VAPARLSKAWRRCCDRCGGSIASLLRHCMGCKWDVCPTCAAEARQAEGGGLSGGCLNPACRGGGQVLPQRLVTDAFLAQLRRMTEVRGVGVWGARDGGHEWAPTCHCNLCSPARMARADEPPCPPTPPSRLATPHAPPRPALARPSARGTGRAGRRTRSWPGPWGGTRLQASRQGRGRARGKAPAPLRPCPWRPPRPGGRVLAAPAARTGLRRTWPGPPCGYAWGGG
jgi:hypothetical protein